MRHILPPQKHRKRRVEELHCCTVTGCKSATLLSYLPMLDFGWESHGSREWSRPGKAGCNDGDAGTGDRCHGGDEGDQGGWMVRHGHLNGDLIWIWCELFSFLDFQDNFCFLISGECFLLVMVPWFVGRDEDLGVVLRFVSVFNRIFRCLFVIRSFLTWGRICKRKVSKGCQLETVGVLFSCRQLAVTEIGRKSSFEKNVSLFPCILMLRNLSFKVLSGAIHTLAG